MAFGRRGRERQRFQLFDSAPFGAADLLFKDVTEKLSILEDNKDISQVLGLDYVALLKGLGHEGAYLSTWAVGVYVGCSLGKLICCYIMHHNEICFLLLCIYRKLIGGQCCALVLH